MKKWLTFLGIGLVVLILLVWFGGRRALSFSTADYSGDIYLSGIIHPVEITFDAKGIPQIWAQNDRDMYFALGWLHASERLFQMELVRRLVAGKLSEIFGEVAYEVDLKQRRIGFARKARRDMANLQPETRQILRAYCDGINAWVKHIGILPPEFVLLGFSPQEWQIEDCLGISVYQTWYSHELMDMDSRYNKLVEKLGDVIKPALRQQAEWSSTTVHDSGLKQIFSESYFPLNMSVASNSWAVAPEKSISGAVIHASDPHLQIYQVPGFWYVVGLHSREGINVLGVSAPGLPSVAMGHNASIAYAFTVASIDIVDYYREQRHPQDSLQVLTASGYKTMDVIEDEIIVKDESQPRKVRFYRTSHGPVVETDSASVLSLKWAGFDFDACGLVHSAMKLHRVANFQQFREAVTGFGALDVNWTYSDVNGNIGYQLGAPIPRRNYSDTFFQLAGEDSTKNWNGYYPLEETPHLLNPSEGWLATCNNRIVSDKWPYDLPGFYDPYRINRISGFLGEEKAFSAADFEKMQLDLVSGVATRWKGLMAKGAAKLNKPELVSEIQDWDGAMTVGSKTAALFEIWWHFLDKHLFEDELGDDWESGKYIKEEVLTANLLQVIDDKRTASKVEDAGDISAATLSEVLEKFGRKKYGEVCKLILEHPLSRVRILDYWLNLNRGPYPIGGDQGSLKQNYLHWDDSKSQFRGVVGPSMRFVLDWSDVDGFTINTNMGQSGNPFSPHYDDFLEMMRTGERWVVPFSKEKVYEQKSSILKLLPQKKAI